MSQKETYQNQPDIGSVVFGVWCSGFKYSFRSKFQLRFRFYHELYVDLGHDKEELNEPKCAPPEFWKTAKQNHL